MIHSIGNSTMTAKFKYVNKLSCYSAPDAIKKRTQFIFPRNLSVKFLILDIDCEMNVFRDALSKLRNDLFGIMFINDD